MQFAANTLAEVSTMSDTPRSPMSSLTDHPVARTVGSTVPLIRAAVCAVTGRL